MSAVPIHRTEIGTWIVDKSVQGVQMDSRRVQPGDIFVAVVGAHEDGHAFVSDAIRRGAVAVVAEHPVHVDAVPTVLVPSARIAAAELAATIYKFPGRDLTVAGVTGTDGKTSVVFWLHYLLESSGHPAGMLSSVLNIAGPHRQSLAGLTTPEASEVQHALALTRDAGWHHAVVEVSSHGLDQHRVDAIPFRVAVLTNITREHLDYHGSMDAYIQAKARLFTELLMPDGTAVLNADNPYAAQIRSRCAAAVMTYGIAQGDLRAHIVDEGPWHTRVALIGVEDPAPVVTIPVPGRYNIYNMLAAVGAALSLGISFESIVAHVEALPPVPGRLDVVASGDGVQVVVDYAHTPEGLAQVLQTVRRGSKTRHLWLVLGARGGRDRGKRPMLGAIAGRLADAVIITSDSPNDESPAAIADELASGIREAGSQPYAIELDRRQAISLAVSSAQAGDIVLITGRGPETHQRFGQELVTLVDSEAASEAMARRLQRTPVPESYTSGE